MSQIPALLLLATALAGAGPSRDPSVAAGIVAFDRGDFGTAFAILKPLVYEASHEMPPRLPDPFAMAFLGQMLRRGDAAPADWPLSCALFRLAFHAAAERWPSPERPPIPFAAKGIGEVCLPEQQDEVNALMSSGFRDGVTRQQFDFDDSVRVVVDRLGFHLDSGAEHRDIDLLAVRGGDVAISITQAAVSATDERSRRRHFLELFKWTSHFDSVEGHVVRAVHWMVFEVRGADVAIAMDQPILTVLDGAYPSPELPAGVRDAAVLRLDASGDVEWLWKGAPRKRGILGRP